MSIMEAVCCAFCKFCGKVFRLDGQIVFWQAYKMSKLNFDDIISRVLKVTFSSILVEVTETVSLLSPNILLRWILIYVHIPLFDAKIWSSYIGIEYLIGFLECTYCNFKILFCKSPSRYHPCWSSGYGWSCLFSHLSLLH